MKFIHFICHLGVVLSLAGAGHCVRRYIAYERIIPLYASVKEPDAVIKRFEDILKGLPHGKELASMYRSQARSIEASRDREVELLRSFQVASRDEGILFAMLFLLFGVLSLRLSGSNKSLQPTPSPFGLGRG